MFESWPNHHKGLRQKVAKAILSQPSHTVICALEGYYLPHGGSDEMWIVLTTAGGTIIRTRTLHKGASTNVTRLLNEDESLTIRERLMQLEAWNLPHFKQRVRDGWPCAIAIADKERLHSIQTHNPKGQHLALISYLLGLIPLQSDKHTTDEPVPA